MNIAEKLKDAPIGTKLYSPMFGDVFLVLVSGDFISVHTGNSNCTYGFDEEGKYTKHGECMLFPSKDNRDWNIAEFDIDSLKPFDKVLVRDFDNDIWKADFYSYYEEEATYHFRCVGTQYIQCIPYNNETRHLLGTKKKCPEYYKTW